MPDEMETFIMEDGLYAVFARKSSDPISEEEVWISVVKKKQSESAIF